VIAQVDGSGGVLARWNINRAAAGLRTGFNGVLDCFLSVFRLISRGAKIFKIEDLDAFLRMQEGSDE